MVARLQCAFSQSMLMYGKHVCADREITHFLQHRTDVLCFMTLRHVTLLFERIFGLDFEMNKLNYMPIHSARSLILRCTGQEHTHSVLIDNNNKMELRSTTSK